MKNIRDNMLKQTLILALIGAQIFTGGCYRRVEIPKTEWVDQAQFTPIKNDDSFVVLKKAGKGSTEFSEMTIENQQLIGQSKTVNGVDLKTIPIEDVYAIQKKEYSAGQTAFAVVGGIVGGGALIFGAIIGIWLSALPGGPG